MIPAAIRLLATRPELLTQHLGAYAVLASAETGEWIGALQRRAVWGALAATLALAALLLGGGALLLAAAVPWQQMPAPWTLIVLPVALAVAAALCGWLASRPAPAAFEALRTQLHLDLQMWHGVGQAQQAAEGPAATRAPDSSPPPSP